MITSISSARVKQVATLTEKAKYRKEIGLFTVEGEKMFSKFPKERTHAVYTTEKFLADSVHREMMKDVRKVETASEGVLKIMSDTQTPQDILALVRQYKCRVEDILESPGSVHVMIPETIQNPGNLGAILRVGEGVGVTGIIMSNGTTDVYSPKVIRSIVGPVYHVPLVYMGDLRAALNLLRKQNIHLYTIHLAGKSSYDEEDYRGGTGSLIGNEANGLEGETVATADTLIRIPILGQVESLNAAMTSTILMYETARQ